MASWQTCSTTWTASWWNRHLRVQSSSAGSRGTGRAWTGVRSVANLLNRSIVKTYSFLSAENTHLLCKGSITIQLTCLSVLDSASFAYVELDRDLQFWSNPNLSNRTSVVQWYFPLHSKWMYNAKCCIRILPSLLWDMCYKHNLTISVLNLLWTSLLPIYSLVLPIIPTIFDIGMCNKLNHQTSVVILRSLLPTYSLVLPILPKMKIIVFKLLFSSA